MSFIERCPEYMQEYIYSVWVGKGVLFREVSFRVVLIEGFHCMKIRGNVVWKYLEQESVFV